MRKFTGHIKKLSDDDDDYLYGFLTCCLNYDCYGHQGHEIVKGFEHHVTYCDGRYLPNCSTIL